MDGMVQLSKLFSRIIDFRSRFTAMHTSGVGATAESLATLWGFSKMESIMMQIAGNIHDLGMFSVPAEIMEKPSVLTKEESNVVKKHSYHTFHALEPFENLRTMSEWASFHHERIDGSGYPFRLDGKNLSLGSRIMAVADIFTALTENRPYRKGMTPEDSLAIVEQMANSSTLDPEVVKLLKANFDQINSSRMAIELASTDQYQQLYEQVEPKTKAQNNNETPKS
jgi:HD-GYP domain-containing protein (c-di-GMP phosphodiesterase class II)